MFNNNCHWMGIDVGSTTVKVALVHPEYGNLVFADYQRHNARQPEALADMLRKVQADFPVSHFKIAVCGSGGLPFAKALSGQFIQEVVANTLALKKHFPRVRSAIELGGEDAKVIYFRKDPNTGQPIASDMRMNGSCAGGTGAFIDQMAELLNTGIQEFNDLASKGKRVYPVSGRCGVFAKTDIQPLLNQGAPKADIALSCFHAIAKQTIGGLAQGLEIQAPVVFEGGPFIFNPKLIQVFEERLGLSKGQTSLPDSAETFIAYGAALSLGSLFRECEKTSTIGEMLSGLDAMQKKRKRENPPRAIKPLFSTPWEKEAFLVRHQGAGQAPPALAPGRVKAYLGIDAGSTTSKFVLLDEEEAILHSFYTGNSGAPLETIRKGLLDMERRFEQQNVELDIVALGVTGYGEALSARAFGADFHTVETVAHAEAARRYQPRASFILDMGGQDMKAIWLEKGIITRILLNEACSAGCGSFLETYARSLNIAVEDIAGLAFQSRHPSNLGSRCTVFMNSSIITEQRNGRTPADIMAGLCRSVVENFFMKVGRIHNPAELGEYIVVQGGTFRNNAVLRAFEEYVGRPVTRPPRPGLMGAIGVTLLTMQERNSRMGAAPSRFIGFQGLRDFTVRTEPGNVCPSCQNSCNRTVLHFSNGEYFVSGNRCDRGEVLQRVAASPSSPAHARHAREAEEAADRRSLQKVPLRNDKIPDMVSYYRKQLLRDYHPQSVCSHRGESIGIPLALDFWRILPFWRTLFTALGFDVVISGRSSLPQFERGLATVSSDTICFPAKVTHGHVMDLLDKNVDRIWMPVMISLYTHTTGRAGKAVCPVVSGYPMVLANNLKLGEKAGIPILHPVFDWKSQKLLHVQVASYLKETFGIRRRQATEAILQAEAAMHSIRERLLGKGREILSNLTDGQFAVVLACRPYQLDPFINHNISRFFTSMGIPVLTLDGIRHDNYDITPSRIEIYNPVHARMLSGAMAVAGSGNLELVQILSFGCGHDAILADEVSRILLELSGKSPLQLKLDEGEVEGPMKIRIRSFIETIRSRRRRQDIVSCAKPELPDPFPVRFMEADKKRRLILIPNLSPAFSMLASTILDKMGFSTRRLEIAGPRAIELGKRYVHNDICFPAQINIGEMLAYLENHPQDQAELCLGLAKNCENCRAGQYPALARKALDEAGYPDIPIVTTGADNKNMHPGFKTNLTFQINMVWGMAMVDAVEGMYRAVRPYAIVPGQAESVYREQLNAVIGGIRKHRTTALRRFAGAVRAFNGVETDRRNRKPRVGLLGEVLIKYHPGANNYIDDYLVQNGMETIQPPMIDFFRRGELIRTEKRKRQMLSNPFMAWLIGNISEGVYKQAVNTVDNIFRDFKYYEPHADVYGLAAHAEGLIDLTFKVGEGWLIAAEIIEWARLGVNSFVIMQPFGCLPNHVSGRGMCQALKEKLPHIQILSLDFDPDTSFANIENRLQMLIINAREMEQSLQKKTASRQLRHGAGKSRV